MAKKKDRWRKLVKITKNQTHHFFVVDPATFMPMMRDSDGSILVYLDRDQAERETCNRYGHKITCAVVGMGDDKWEMFKRSEKYRIVPKA